MARPNRRHCKRCHRHVSEAGSLSARGRCYDCGSGHMVENAEQLAAHAGPYFDHWRRRCLAAFGVFPSGDG